MTLMTIEKDENRQNENDGGGVLIKQAELMK